MASEPRCCQTLSGWKQTFSHWIGHLEAEDLLQAKIFFDFRGILDQQPLTAALHAHLRQELERQPRFIHLLARSILQYEPPLNAFGGFALEVGAGTHDVFDIKGVVAQVVDYARLRALQHGIDATGTLARLEALAAGNHLHRDTASATADTFTLLMHLRLQHQATQVLERRSPDNFIAPASLDDDQRRRLKAAFNQLKTLQTALDQEFKGG